MWKEFKKGPNMDRGRYVSAEVLNNRDKQVWRLHKKGWTQLEIAQKLQISSSRVSQIIWKVKEQNG